MWKLFSKHKKKMRWKGICFSLRLTTIGSKLLLGSVHLGSFSPILCSCCSISNIPLWSSHPPHKCYLKIHQPLQCICIKYEDFFHWRKTISLKVSFPLYSGKLAKGQEEKRRNLLGERKLCNGREKSQNQPRSLEVIRIKRYSDFCMTSYKKDKFSEN